MGFAYGADNMTEEIFRRDGYAFEFEANVVSVDGDWIELDTTAFYPGGGGQVCDTGTIRGSRVTEVCYRKGVLSHRVPGNDLEAGDTAWCSVDWDRRYDLMMGHTGEHLLFCSLKRRDPSLSISKIFISPESKYVIVDHDIGWNEIREAVGFANKAIGDNLPVTRSIMDRDDPELANVRMKMDRIEDGEDISVVSIGDIDLSACSGIHVMETSELEMIMVDRKVSAGKDGIAIHFRVGRDAMDSAAELANTCLQAADAADSKPEDLVRAIGNMRHDMDLQKDALRQCAGKQISEMRPEVIGGVDVFSETFAYAERTMLSDAAESVKNKGGVAIFASSGDTVSVILASGSDRVDCRSVLSAALSEFGGRGGGKVDFAQGGIPDATRTGTLMSSLTDKVRMLLQ